jgi:DNA-binding XRE family transcriptional regulator
MPILPVLSSRLRRLRQRHALTQEAFAEVAGLSYKFYQQIEAGRKKQVWLETVARNAARTPPPHPSATPRSRKKKPATARNRNQRRRRRRKLDSRRA